MTTPTDPQEQPSQRQTESRGEKIFTGVAQLALVAAIVLGPIIADLQTDEPVLEIVSSPVQDTLTKSWSLAGRVITPGKSRGGPVRVWAIAVDSVGNRFSPPDTVTDAAGRFTLGPIPLRLTGDSVQQLTEVTVYALAQTMDSASSTYLRGEENLRLSRAGRMRWLAISPWEWGSLGVIFFSTLGLGLIHVPVRFRRAKYFMLVVLSVMFTLAMISLVAVGLRNVNAEARHGDVMSLGFATIHQGTYVKDVPVEWLFSLTTPQVWKPGEVTTGFGIPLWLLLIAVLGSGVYTIALLVRHVKEREPVESEHAYSERVSELVQHQFYMLFSPLGAVLVYQLMVVAGAASVPVTVAIVVFAAGVAANSILDRAVKAIANVLGEDDPKKKKDEEERRKREEADRLNRP